MCGFVALFDSQGSISGKKIERMCDLIAHRGPNHFDSYQDEHIAFGHRRLSIIDLSKQAHQPMTKGDCVLVYNGEIYNYLEIKKELEKNHDARFETQSDTEVILEAYRQWGVECVKKFNGMFAFVLWDRRKKRLFVARDRLGVKPLFIAREGTKYFLASDIKSLWELIPPAGRLNPKAIYNYFSQAFISEQETSTNGIEKFPMAHYATIGDGGEERVRYWDLNDVQKRGVGAFRDVVDETEALLSDAIALRLRSDVPVGCFLSGGVDSSLVTAMTANQLGDSFHTYSIGFDEEARDESVYAQRVAEKYQTRHTHQRLGFEALELLPEIVWHYSELFGDSSSIPSYFVSQLAKEGLTVVLTGDGADEAFGGYVDPFAVYLHRIYKRIPAFLRKGLSKVASGSKLRRLSRFNDLSLLNLDELYADLKDGNWNQYGYAFAQNGEGSYLSTDYLKACVSDDDVDRLLYSDIYDRLCHDFFGQGRYGDYGALFRSAISLSRLSVDGTRLFPCASKSISSLDP